MPENFARREPNGSKTVISLATEADVAAISSPSLTVTKMPFYEYRDIWAEESGGLSNNNEQWSYGNGATGYIGLPIDSGWECVAMYFNADVIGSTNDVTITLVDYRTPSDSAPVIATISVINAGTGVANNGYQYTEFPNPLAVPDGAILGFRTVSEVGSVSDARVGARLRRQVGEYVTDVTQTAS